MTSQKKPKWQYAFVLLYAWGAQAHENSQKIMLSFDTYPVQGWLQKAVNACMHVWGTMRVLMVEKNSTDINGDYCIHNKVDAMIGNLVYVHFCLKKMYTDDYSNDKILGECIDYLKKVVQKMSAEATGLSQKVDADHVACVEGLLAQVRETLDAYV